MSLIVLENLRITVGDMYWNQARNIRAQIVFNKQKSMGGKHDDDKEESHEESQVLAKRSSINDDIQVPQQVYQSQSKKRRTCGQAPPPSSDSSTSSMSCLDGSGHYMNSAPGNGISPIVSETDINCKGNAVAIECSQKQHRACSNKNELF